MVSSPTRNNADAQITNTSHRRRTLKPGASSTMVSTTAAPRPSLW
ncbi:hypothetical protein CZ674_06800 [Agrococcus casei LMG 22410]|uniref:Uncharacterized protein n=1 Tax=Agrococcus casei LMG 22410 TaxID=1255656 RepID=A0A1R4FVR0_9MICO|nr:hypothetical protein CZ674_06800 [Agrococcus casei LMG 22410]